MNGKIFEQALKQDNRSMKDLAKLFDVVPSTLYDIFKKNQVPAFYMKRAEEIGVKLPQHNTIKHNIAPTKTESEIWKELALSQQETILNLSRALSLRKSETV